MMTPFELSIERELDVESQRFHSQWLFRWHNINIENYTVDVEDFKGGRITVGGIVFQGQIQSIYWQAIERYLSVKIHEVFARWDTETAKYPPDLRASSLESLKNLMRRFVARIMQRAIDTDQRLRGRGNPPRDIPMDASATHSRANVEIERLNSAHSALLPKPELPPQQGSRFMESINIKPGVFGMNIDLKKLFSRRKP